MCPEGEVPDPTQSYCKPIPPVSMRLVWPSGPFLFLRIWTCITSHYSWDTGWALIPAGFSLLGLSSTIFVVGVFLKFSNTPVVSELINWVLRYVHLQYERLHEKSARVRFMRHLLGLASTEELIGSLFGRCSLNSYNGHLSKHINLLSWSQSALVHSA